MPIRPLLVSLCSLLIALLACNAAGSAADLSTPTADVLPTASPTAIPPTATELPPTVAVEMTWLEIANNTDVDVCYLYITLPGEAPDQSYLTDPLPPGEVIQIDVPRGIYDYRAEDCNQQVLHAITMNIQEGGLYMVDQQPTVVPLTLTLINTTDVTVCRVWYAPLNSQWVRDILNPEQKAMIFEGEATIPPTVTIPPGGTLDVMWQTGFVALKAESCEGEELDTDQIDFVDDVTWSIGE